MKATLKNYRQSPRKARLVADFVRGKRVDQALIELSFLPKRAAAQIQKVINSAVANAKENHKINRNNLFIQNIHVDQGVTLHRFMPRAQGRATPINKRTSNITVVLEERGQDEKQETKDKSPEKNKETKKTVEANEAT